MFTPGRIARQRPRRSRLSLEALEDRVLLAAYHVTLLGDAGSADPANANSGDLRWAIRRANNGDSIDFMLPGAGTQTINLVGTLSIARAITIDGYTQQGATANNAAFGNPINASPLIIVKNGGGVLDGIQIRTDGATVKGLVLEGFVNGSGIRIAGSNNKVQGNFIGTDETGKNSAGNNTGVYIANGTGNLIGGTNAADRNLISGNIAAGVAIDGSNSLVKGDYIGTDITGAAALGNGLGVAIGYIASVSQNVIGGPEAGAANLISGNVAGGCLGRWGGGFGSGLNPQSDHWEPHRHQWLGDG